MKVDTIDTVIAERVLDGEHNGKPCTVAVRVGKPFLDTSREGSCWCCPYSITSPKGEHFFYAAGLDSLQALQLVISMIGAELASVYSDLKLRWAGESDLGFPR